MLNLTSATETELQASVFRILSDRLQLSHFAALEEEDQRLTFEETYGLLFHPKVDRASKDKLISFLKAFQRSKLARRKRAIARLIIKRWNHAPHLGV